ncbi:MAG TPA: hypothetical protein PLQ35_03475, partial [bacterium]|nr:hypothetical protein [bacterium]
RLAYWWAARQRRLAYWWAARQRRLAYWWAGFVRRNSPEFAKGCDVAISGLPRFLTFVRNDNRSVILTEGRSLIEAPNFGISSQWRLQADFPGSMKIAIKP